MSSGALSPFPAGGRDKARVREGNNVLKAFVIPISEIFYNDWILIQKRRCKYTLPVVANPSVTAYSRLNSSKRRIR